MVRNKAFVYIAFFIGILLFLILIKHTTAQPELTIAQSDISFSKNVPTIGDEVKINAWINNIGNENATNVEVGFYDGDPALNDKIGTYIVPKVEYNNRSIATVNWSTTAEKNGTHLIFVSISVYPGEINTTNNIANKSIKLNLPPNLNYSVDAYTKLTYEDFIFSAKDSNDTDGSVVSYLWLFGDGNFEKGMTTSHSYIDDGNYTVVLIITDNDGGTNTTSFNITVINRAPYVFVSNQTVLTYELGLLDASSSYDKDGYITNYTWLFQNGTVKYGSKVSFFYEDGSYKPGKEYRIELLVFDDDSFFTKENVSVFVINRAPKAIINASKIKISFGEEVTFDAESSYDVDGYITNYTWVFYNGEKRYGSKTKYTYNLENGSYNTTLIVI
ncbi:MAG: PKD domain-containing protein, partial [Candidatus Thermoplasmatota archaeon]